MCSMQQTTTVEVHWLQPADTGPGSVCRYVATPAYSAHEKDARKQKAAAGVAKRKAEEALLNLHRRQAALQQPPSSSSQPAQVCEHPLSPDLFQWINIPPS